MSSAPLLDRLLDESKQWFIVRSRKAKGQAIQDGRAYARKFIYELSYLDLMQLQRELLLWSPWGGNVMKMIDVMVGYWWSHRYKPTTVSGGLPTLGRHR